MNIAYYSQFAPKEQRIESLKRREIELRYMIQHWKPLFFISKVSTDYRALQREPYEHELQAVRAELRELKGSASTVPVPRWFKMLVAVILTSIVLAWITNNDRLPMPSGQTVQDPTSQTCSSFDPATGTWTPGPCTD